MPKKVIETTKYATTVYTSGHEESTLIFFLIQHRGLRINSTMSPLSLFDERFPGLTHTVTWTLKNTQWNIKLVKRNA